MSNSESELGEPFPTETCPCGDPQPDPEHLYCEDCIDRMAREWQESVEEARSA